LRFRIGGPSKVQKLLAASALLCGRTAASPADLWVLRYVWDREEQIGPLGALINGLLAQHPAEGATHPLAAVTSQADGEELARQLDALEQQMAAGAQSLTVLARLRERLADLADRAAWLADNESRKHLLARARTLLERLG
jgi:MoxR-like ATPase